MLQNLDQAAPAIDQAEVVFQPLPEELDFYGDYDWCLKRHLSLGEARLRISGEADKLPALEHDWQVGEVATNIALLSCGILNCVDEYIRGRALRLPKRLRGLAPVRMADAALALVYDGPWSLARRRIRRWRVSFAENLNSFLVHFARMESLDRQTLRISAQTIIDALQDRRLTDLRSRMIGIPSPFSRLDLTLCDVMSLKEKLVDQVPDRSRPLLLLGLRTSGSYIAPLLKASLQVQGYSTRLLTIEPSKGAGRWESKALGRSLREGYRLVIVDDPPASGDTVLAAIGIALDSGCDAKDIVVAAPMHPSSRNWAAKFPRQTVVTLRPDEWHRAQLLENGAVQRRLEEYFRARGYRSVRVVDSAASAAYSRGVERAGRDPRSSKLKRVFEVELVSSGGGLETAFVFAKSVGSGWLGYHAFIAATRLSPFVPEPLGFRDGILYTRWIPQDSSALAGADDRRALIAALVDYSALRTRKLGLGEEARNGLDTGRYANGTRLLQNALSRAYGPFPINSLMLSRIRRAVVGTPCPHPVLIDGNIDPSKWISSGRRLIKTDYEHHGMGKGAVNVADPAYDLADAVLKFALTADEERELLSRYIAATGDLAVRRRLFLCKLAAGIWAMDKAREQLLGGAKSGEKLQRSHREFMAAWDFLTREAAIHCGSLCESPRNPAWRAPLVFTDVDGVLDRRLFGFPTTSAAGIEALSVFHRNGISVALNTARSVAEVKDYCRAYSLAGGVAEYGSYAWDAIAQRGRVLIDKDAEQQLHRLRNALRKIPGVFMDERHQYSIRAFSYRKKSAGFAASLLNSSSFDVGDGSLEPLSPLLIQQLITDLGFDLLTFRQTTIDTTITAKALDKGTGLVAFRDWVLHPSAETIAIGDHEADFPMFRAATRCFAPRNLRSTVQAAVVGCSIAPRSYQSGLLDIACEIAGSAVPDSSDATARKMALANGADPFLDALCAADQPWFTHLQKAVREPGAFSALIRS